jgi:hypothetical protein
VENWFQVATGLKVLPNIATARKAMLKITKAI